MPVCALCLAGVSLFAVGLRCPRQKFTMASLTMGRWIVRALLIWAVVALQAVSKMGESKTDDGISAGHLFLIFLVAVVQEKSFRDHLLCH